MGKLTLSNHLIDKSCGTKVAVNSVEYEFKREHNDGLLRDIPGLKGY